MSFRKIIAGLKNPFEAVSKLGWEVAFFQLKKQLINRAAQTDIIKFDKKHYSWLDSTDDYLYSLYCIQETNLLNFTKNMVGEKVYQSVAEIGANSDLILKHVRAEKKIAVNVQDGILQYLEGLGLIAIKADGLCIPLADEESDLTICFETLEHVPNPILFLSELERITRKDGKILLSIPWVDQTNVLSKNHGGVNLERALADNHVFEFSPRDFRKIITYTGLTIDKYRKLENYRYQYDFLSNHLVKRHFANDYFPAIQAYSLVK